MTTPSTMSPAIIIHGCTRTVCARSIGARQSATTIGAVSSDDARLAPWYPYEVAIGNCIFLLIAFVAVLDDQKMAFLNRLGGSVLLLALGGMLAVRTRRTGYVPRAEATPRLRPGQRNIPGWATVAIVLADLIIVPLLWVS